MAKNEDGILGPLKGKVGPVVGSSWRGIAYVKSAPNRKKPPTEGELKNRHIFAFTQKWLQPLKDFLDVGFKNYSQTNFGVNAAKSFLYENALIKDGMNSKIVPSQMQISYGDLPLPKDIAMEWKGREDGSGELTVTWGATDRSDEYKFDFQDQVMVLAYAPTDKEAFGVIHGAFRATGTQLINIETDVRQHEYHVWVAFMAADRERQSHSLYLGPIVEIEQNELSQDVVTEEVSIEEVP